MKRISFFVIFCFFFSFLFLFACQSDTKSNDGAKSDSLSEQIAENEIAPPRLVASNSTSVMIPEDEISNSRQNAITRAVEQVSPSVVGINVVQIREQPRYRDPFYEYFFRNSPYRQQAVQSLGSGFFVSADGYIVTNEHVVHNATQIVVTLTGGKKYDAQLIGSDFTTDIALLKVDGNNFPYARMGNSNDIIIGEWTIAFGNPFGLFEVGAEPSVSVGVVSATNRDFGRQNERVYQDMIQTDAAINSGNSGGPLVNCNGDVIGVNAFIYSGSEHVGTSIGLGFAIPINRVKQVLRDLKESGSVNRRFRTGLRVESISRLMAWSLGLRSDGGVIISDVEKDSPAERAGLQVWDIILLVNDKKVTTVEDIWAVIDENDVKGGDELRLKILRKNQQYDARLRLERIP
ncbi:trypsin-like peptidase domain-containing protein [candidate division KSB1 bacterium]|nr:trypsin-like peptidase domain-containing protein [candidate division KSB1 bacterium]